MLVQIQQFPVWSLKKAWGVFGEDVGSKEAAVKPPWMGSRRSSTDTPHALNTAQILKLGIAGAN